MGENKLIFGNGVLIIASKDVYHTKSALLASTYYYYSVARYF